MFFRKVLIAFIVFAGVSCRQSHGPFDSHTQVSDLLDSAEAATASLDEKLRLAFKADSLSLKAKNDTLHLASIKKIATLYLREGNSPMAQEYYRRMSVLAEDLADSENLAIAFGNIARILNDASAYDSAQQYFSRANRMFRLMRDSVHLAQGLLNEGIAHKNAGQYEKAFQLTMEAVSVLELSGKRSDLASAYTNLGNILKDLNRLDDALNYHEKALTMRTAENDTVAIAGSLNNIGNIHRSRGNYKLALVSYFQAAETKKRSGISKSLATTYGNIATVYLEMRSYHEAEVYYTKALNIQRELNDKDGFFNSSNRLARLFLETNQPRKAETMVLPFLGPGREPAFLKQRLETMVTLFEIARTEKDPAKLSFYADSIARIKDRLFNKDMAEAVSKMEALYKTRQAVKELSFSQSLQKSQLLQIRGQKLMIVMLTAILLLLSWITYLLYRSNKLRKQGKDRVELLMKELNHRVKNNLQMITSLFNFQLAGNPNPEVQKSLSAALKRVESIGMAHRLLHQSAEYTGAVSAREFVNALLSALGRISGRENTRYQLTYEIEELQLDMDSAISLGIITNELLTNICKYGETDSGGTVAAHVSFSRVGNDCILIVRDNAGYWDIKTARKSTTGTGLFLVETLVAQLKGKWTTDSSSEGTSHQIQFKEK